MRNVNPVFRLVSVTLLVLVNVLFVHAEKGDFGAWELKSGHGGMSCGTVGFAEKSITIEFWMYLNSADVEKIAILGTSGPDAGFLVSVRANSANAGALELRLFAKDTQKNTAHFYIPREYFVDKWVHVAYVISAEEEKAYAYLNGGYFAEKDAIGGYFGNSTTALGIGQWWSDPKPYGKLAEIRIWNIARTGDEIAANYNRPLTGTEDGLYIYYNFDDFAQIISNVANPGTNNGSLSPAATWSDVHAYEVLSAIPANLSLTANTLTWNGTAESFELEVVEKGTNNVVKTDVVTGNSYSLAELGLDGNKEYYANVRAKNALFYSGWATTNSNTSGIEDINSSNLTVFIRNNAIIVNSDVVRKLNVFAVDGRLVRSVDLSVGENVINNISRGMYLIDKQKVVVY